MRRARSTPTAATSPRSARVLGKPLADARRRRARALRRRSSAPTGSRRRRSRGARRRRAASSGTCSCSARREDNPAAAVALPRRARTLPKTLSPGEAERLIDGGATARSRATCATTRSSSCSTAPGCASRRRSGSSKAGVDLDDRLVRVVGKGGKERIVPIGRPAVEALRRYLSRGRPYLDRRHRPELFLNARGGALTRAGRVPDPAPAGGEGGARPAARPPAPAAPLVRHAPARGRRRPPLGPGDARARRPVDDRALHPRLRPAAAGRLLRCAPARAATPDT